MSLRGGYQIINLDNREFSTEQGNVEKYEDIYKNLLNSHAKFIVLSGLNMDGIKWGDREAIFYEQQNGDGMYFQAELRRIWNTADKTCTTKYINIYPNDTVKMTVDSFIYEPDNDKSLNNKSTNAVENKVIYNEFRKVYYNDGSQKLTAPLNMGSNPVFNNDTPDNTYIFENGEGELSILKAGSRTKVDDIKNDDVLTKLAYRILDDHVYDFKNNGSVMYDLTPTSDTNGFAKRFIGNIRVTRHSIHLRGGFNLNTSKISENKYYLPDENTGAVKLTITSEDYNGLASVIGLTRNSILGDGATGVSFILCEDYETGEFTTIPFYCTLKSIEHGGDVPTSIPWYTLEITFDVSTYGFLTPNAFSEWIDFIITF